MAEWQSCFRCNYYFEPNNDKKNYKVVEYKGSIVGVICPHCSGLIWREGQAA